MELAIIIVAVWILSTCFHEFGHAITAYWGGDKTVKEKGYLTLNPIAYFNSSFSLIFPIIILLVGGIPLPGAAVYINTGRIKSRFMQSLVSFAGPLFTLIFLIGISILFQFLPSMHATIGDAQYDIVVQAFSALIYLHIFVFILNLLPIPPLDGFGIIDPWLPKAAQLKAREFGKYGFLLLIGLFMFCAPVSLAMSFFSAIVATFIGVDYDNVRIGLTAVQKSSYPLLGLIIVAWIIKSKVAPGTEKAKQLLKENKFTEALELFDQALAKKEDSQTLMSSAHCLLSLGRKQEALARSQRACQLDPDSAQALSFLTACLGEVGDYTGALEMADKALEKDTNSDFPYTYLIKASVLAELNRWPEALTAIDRYLEKVPAGNEGLFIRASCLENLGQFEEALAVYNKAARSSSDNSIRATLARGLLLCALGRQTEGLGEFNKILPAEAEKRDSEISKLKELLAEYASKLEQNSKKEMAEAARSAIAQVA